MQLYNSHVKSAHCLKVVFRNKVGVDESKADRLGNLRLKCYWSRCSATFSSLAHHSRLPLLTHTCACGVQRILAQLEEH